MDIFSFFSNIFLLFLLRSSSPPLKIYFHLSSTEKIILRCFFILKWGRGGAQKNLAKSFSRKGLTWQEYWSKHFVDTMTTPPLWESKGVARTFLVKKHFLQEMIWNGAKVGQITFLTSSSPPPVLVPTKKFLIAKKSCNRCNRVFVNILKLTFGRDPEAEV